MVSKPTSFYLSDDANAKIDIIVDLYRKVGKRVSRSAVLEELISYAYPFIKANIEQTLRDEGITVNDSEELIKEIVLGRIKGKLQGVNEYEFME